MTKMINILFTIVLGALLSGCEKIGTAEFEAMQEQAGENSGESNDSSGDNAVNTNDLDFAGIDSIDQVNATSARLNWTHNADAVAYEVYNATSSLAFTSTVFAPTSNYTITGLSADTTYKFIVKAKGVKGRLDDNANEVSFTTKLAQPSGLSLQDPTTSPNADQTPTIRISGVHSGQTVKLYSDSGCSTEAGSATAGGSTVDITSTTLSNGVAYNFYAKTFTDNGNESSCSSATVSYTPGINCPPGYVYVPGDSNLGTSHFCVMKYEAKNDGSGNPVSQEAGAPWNQIRWDQAKTECNSLGSKYDLLSNPEYMTIAHNVEAQPENWSSGSVGNGCIFIGNAAFNNACGYDGPNPDYGANRDSKASLQLSTGEKIWDLSGNLWEMLDWTVGGALAKGPTTCPATWVEVNNVNCGALAANDYQPLNPAGVTASSYNSAYGLGKFYGDTGGGARRGGAMGLSGLYSLQLRFNPTSTRGSAMGFRCVYRPWSN